MESSNISSSRHPHKLEKHLCIRIQTNQVKCTDEAHFYHCYRNLEAFLHTIFLKKVLFHNRKIFPSGDEAHKYILFAEHHYFRKFLSMLTNPQLSIRQDKELYYTPELILVFAVKNIMKRSYDICSYQLYHIHLDSDDIIGLFYLNVSQIIQSTFLWIYKMCP